MPITVTVVNSNIVFYDGVRTLSKDRNDVLCTVSNDNSSVVEIWETRPDESGRNIILSAHYSGWVPTGSTATIVCQEINELLTSSESITITTTVTDGDYGDVQVSGGGLIWTLTNSYVQTNDSRLSDSRSPKLAHKNFTPASNTGTTSEEILHSHQLAAGEVAAGDMIEFYTNWLITASANSKTYRAYVNTSNSLAGATLIAALVQNTSTIAGDNFARFLPVISDTSLECFGGSGNATRSPYAVTTNTTTTIAVPSVSAGFWIIFTGQKASSGETNSLRWSMIEIHKS